LKPLSAEDQGLKLSLLICKVLIQKYFNCFTGWRLNTEPAATGSTGMFVYMSKKASSYVTRSLDSLKDGATIRLFSLRNLWACC